MFRIAMTTILSAALVGAGLMAGVPTAVATTNESRASLGPCNTAQSIKFTNTGTNGGVSTIQNCYSTSKRVAMRGHFVSLPFVWDKNGPCQTLRPGAKTTYRNTINAYGSGWVWC